jgi:hypothetical protein
MKYSTIESFLTEDESLISPLEEIAQIYCSSRRSMVDLDTLYVEDSRAAKRNESIPRRKDRSNHLGTLKDRDNPSVTQEGHVQVLGSPLS